MGKRQVVLEPKLCKITGLSHVLAPTGVDTFVRGGGGVLTWSLPLKMDSDRLSPSLQIIEYATFALIMYLKNKAQLVLEYLMSNSIRIKFQSSFVNVVRGDLQVFLLSGPSSQ